MIEFIEISGRLIPVSLITEMDVSSLDKKLLVVHTATDKFNVTDPREQLEILWKLHPQSLEGQHFVRWHRHAWSIHNIIGHPLMQILSWFGYYELAIRVHDKTVPKPKGYK